MKLKLYSFGLLVLSGLSVFAADAPLRVFVRGGVKTHAPGAHEHAQFLKDWQPLLASRGMKVDGGMDLPSDDQLKQTDVLLMYAQDGGTVPPSRWASFDEYLKRGGGLVVVHTAAVSLQEDHWKKTIGGCWRRNATKWKEGPMDLYYVENQRPEGGSPITLNASNFHIDDEIYYDMDVSPDVRVLATSYTPNVKEGRQPADGNKTHIYDVQPQMWTYERTAEGGSTPYRAFVSIPGHLYTTFEKPHYRAILMRGIAWAGKRANTDEFCTPEELSSLTYPEGGPQKPADTLKHLEIHPDFDMTLVTAEPLITKPMNFDWDPAGRLWVAETPEYPNGRRGMRPDYRGKEWKDHGGLEPQPGKQDRPGLDKISILTDTDGDGVMDKKDVFYQGLDLVTGLVFYKDGVIVTQAPDILFLRDTDGDGKADKVEKLYTNLGTGDTHAVINNPRMGWDGWIYATHGYSASPDVTSGDGSQHFGGIGSGVVRFKPDGSKIEQFSSKGGNTWGLTVTGDNRFMWTQPTSGTLLNQVVLPEYALARGKVATTASFKTIIADRKSYSSIPYEDLPYVQIDRVGDFTAGAGSVIYDGGSWPAEYNGDYFTTEPTINVIHHERLTPKTTSYEAAKLPGREETEFVRSTDMWWRPIEVRTGPDGAMYVGDFYNQAVIHNDTRGPDHNAVNAAVRPDRDHYFGRIWRIQHKQAKKLEVPDLAKADATQLAAALGHVNRNIRMTASRLLIQGGKGAELVTPFLKDPVPETRIAAIWTLKGLRALEAWMLKDAMESDASILVRRNACNVAESVNMDGQGLVQGVQSSIGGSKGLSDEDATVRLATLRLLASMEISDSDARQIITGWSRLDDDFQRSAAIGAASRNPAASIAAALDSAEAAALTPLVAQLVETMCRAHNSAGAAALVVKLADKPAAVDSLKQTILDTLALKLDEAPAMSPELTAALGKLLASGVSGSVLPVAARWDRAGSLKPEIEKITDGIVAKLGDASAAEDVRLAAATSLLGLRAANPAVIGMVTKILGTDASPSLQSNLITTLGTLNEPTLGPVICGLYSKLPAPVQPAAFEMLLKRADWSIALLDALAAKQMDASSFGPASAYRLRTYPDKAVAQRATGMLDQLNPMAKAKDEIIARLAPLVSKQGDAARGKLLFTATCATCHKLGKDGAEIGPALTGMGSHGPAELLTAIVDPNREVDPSFLAWNIETKDGQLYAGVIARENSASITLKSLAGQQEIKVADIKSRTNTGRSLMPEGFDGLGEEMLRDILTYIVSSDGGKFRTLDLRPAFTTSSANGLYISPENKDDTIMLRKAGNVMVEGVPFNVITPEKNPSGNVVVLKGGGGYALSMPQKVEIPGGGFKANRLHFLGGIAGWGAQGPGKKSPAMKVTVNFADGQKEELMAYDGVEFADYIGRYEVPGSKFVPGLLRNGAQLRWYTKLLQHTGEVATVIMESFGNDVAPTTLAVTAELADPGAPAPGVMTPVTPAPAPAPAPAPKVSAAEVPQAWGQGTKVLLAGGGSSHDFQKFFNEADTAILKAGGYTVQYTENFQTAAAKLAEADVLVFSTNQGSFANVTFRAALDQFAAKGKGIVLLHAGMWYNFKDWPEFNKVYAGGGSRGHDNLSKPFGVIIKQPAHPIMKGVPATFELTDELYYMIPDPAGSPIDVLAEATSVQSGKVFPSVFTVKHDKARIAGIALGHDARAHDLPAFQAILKNAVAWAAGK